MYRFLRSNVMTTMCSILYTFLARKKKNSNVGMNVSLIEICDVCDGNEQCLILCLFGHAAKTTEIPLLIFNNLEEIAGYLDLSELIALGEVCSTARLVAQWVYERDYGSDEFKLRMYKTEVQMSTSINLLVAIVGTNVTCLTFLRNFGDLIPKLNIDLCPASINSSDRLKMVLGRTIAKF